MMRVVVWTILQKIAVAIKINCLLNDIRDTEFIFSSEARGTVPNKTKKVCIDKNKNA